MLPVKSISRETVAVSVAVIFHLVGLVGICWWDREKFTGLTPVNLMLAFGLLMWCGWPNKAWWRALAVAWTGGYLAEVVGVNFGWLFGDYTYGSALGFQWLNVPILIGVNWFLVLTGVLQIAVRILPNAVRNRRDGIWWIALLGAFLAFAFDYLVEPVAVKLGYWQWLGSGEIPIYNYVCWILISFVLLIILQTLQFRKQIWYPGALLITQAVFFLLLNLYFRLF